MKKTFISILLVLLITNGMIFGKSIASDSKDVTDKDHDGFLQLSSMNLEIMQFGLFKPGAGLSYDFEKYLGDKPVPSNAQKYFGYVKPEIGWKFYLFNHFMIDINMNYKWQSVLDRDSLPDYYLDFLDDGFHLGFAFKFFWA